MLQAQSSNPASFFNTPIITITTASTLTIITILTAITIITMILIITIITISPLPKPYLEDLLTTYMVVVTGLMGLIMGVNNKELWGILGRLTK